MMCAEVLTGWFIHTHLYSNFENNGTMFLSNYFVTIQSALIGNELRKNTLELPEKETCPVSSLKRRAGKFLTSFEPFRTWSWARGRTTGRCRTPHPSRPTST